jgi:hypothetical protein
LCCDSRDVTPTFLSTGLKAEEIHIPASASKASQLFRIVKFLQAAIEQMAEGLQTYGLSAEAAEDPEILAARIERIAQIVHRKLR